MALFFKYGFANQAAWEAAQATISTTFEGEVSYDSNVIAVHEIGSVCIATDEEGVCTEYSPLYAVDILWAEMEPTNFVSSKVWPVPSAAVHYFAGWEQFYAEEFCKANPDNPYCAVTLPEAP